MKRGDTMEITVKASTPIPSIEFNFEEIKAELIEKLEYYNSLVVTEESIKEAKSDRAKLNKLKAAIDDKRKEIKKLYLEPYSTFEKQCNELNALITAPISSIDAQIEVFDDEQRERKREELRAYYEVICLDKSLFTLDDFLPPKWANKSKSIESIKTQMNIICDRYAADMQTLSEISAVNQERYSALLSVYLKSKNLNDAINENSRLNQIAETVNVKQEVNTVADERILEASFKVRGTASQIIALRDFMINNQIEFMPIN